MGNNNMASRGLMLSFLKNSIQHNLRNQSTVKGLVVKNSPCIANVVYRKLSSSLVRKGGAEKVELRTQEEITKYVKEETDKNWVGFGAYPWDRFKDNVYGNIAVFFYNYMPDYQMHNWAMREGYLLLKEREDAGIFPISADLIDPEKVKLPSDEELGDIDVRI